MGDRRHDPDSDLDVPVPSEYRHRGERSRKVTLGLLMTMLGATAGALGTWTGMVWAFSGERMMALNDIKATKENIAIMDMRLRKVEESSIRSEEKFTWIRDALQNAGYAPPKK